MNLKLKKYNILWFCPIADPSGYGHVSRQYLSQLCKHEDMNIKIIPRCFNSGEKLKLSVDERKLFEGMIETDFIRDLPILTVFHLQPDNFELVEGSKKHIGMTVFETNGIPPNWKPKIKLMDEIWTFSSLCKSVFERETGKDVKIIPHGVNIDKYKNGVDSMIELKTLIDGKFAFGSSFVWQPRKNPNSLIEAYLREFLTEEVCLVLKVLGADEKYVKNEINKIKEKIQGRKIFPEILLITNTVSDDIMPNFYNSLDAYALLSKGEGWSMSHSEAMSCGLPTIAPAWGGNIDFMSDENSYLVPCTLEQVSDNDAMQQPIFKNQVWAKISVSNIQKTLRQVYEDKNRKLKGELARKDMKKWSWENAGNILYENIVRVME